MTLYERFVGSVSDVGFWNWSTQLSKFPVTGRRFATIDGRQFAVHPRSSETREEEDGGDGVAPAPPRDVLVENPLHIVAECWPEFE